MTERTNDAASAAARGAGASEPPLGAAGRTQDAAEPSQGAHGTARGGPGPSRRALRLLLVAAALHGLAYLLLLPPWMGEDEPWHVEYLHHVAAGRAPWGGRTIDAGGLEELPSSQLQVRRRFAGIADEEIAATQLELLDSMRARHFWQRVDWAGWGGGAVAFDQIEEHFTATHQPLAYYLLLGTGLRVAGVRSVEAQMWCGRATSLLGYLALVALAYAMARELRADGWTALAAALFAAWLPMHARQAGVVNNDVLAKVLAGGSIVLAARVVGGRGGAGAGVGALALAAVGLATKTTAAGALAGLAFALVALVRRARLPRWLTASALVAPVTVAAAAVLYWNAMHNPVVPKTLGNLEERFAVAFSAEPYAELGRTLVGAFNWYARDLPAAAYPVAWALLGAALLASLAAFRRGSGLARAVLALCWSSVLLQVALVALRGAAAGRYLFPVLPALAALVAVGALGLLPERARRRAALALVLLLLAGDAFFLWRGLLLNQYLVWGA